MGLSKNKIKYINSLSLKKNRDIENVFIAEGHKVVSELLPYFIPKIIIHTKYWECDSFTKCDDIVCVDSISDMKKITSFATPSSVLAVFYKSRIDNPLGILDRKQLLLALDNIQDPGNLGTIVRLADWFGIKHIFCSNDTVDIYNAKSIQATMGSIAHVQVHYLNLDEFLLSAQHKKWSIYGTFIDREAISIYKANLNKDGIIVMGNEGKGISKSISALISNRLFIPNYPLGSITTDSLNVAIATSIICSEFRRECIK